MEGGIALGLGRSETYAPKDLSYVLIENPNTGISGDLGLIMTSYKPSVKCRDSPAPPAKNYKGIVDNMRTSSVMKWFGNAGDRHSRPDVELPKFLLES